MISKLGNNGSLSAQNTASAGGVTYDVFGRRIRSFLPLPAPPVEGLPDWELTEGGEESIPVTTENRDGSTTGSHPDLLEIGGFARFIFRGRRVDVRRNAGLAPLDLLGTMTGALTAMLLAREGRLVLHGTSLLRNGRVVVVCGLSGAGKSTQSTYLVRHGWQLHADDVAPIEWRDDEPAIFPGYDVIRLFPDSLQLNGLDPASFPAVHSATTKRLVSLGPGRAPARGPSGIAGVVVLTESEGFAVRRLPEQEAVLSMLYLQHRTAAHFADTSRGGRIAVFQDCARLARRIPVIEIRRAKTVDNLSRTAQAIAVELGV